MVQEDCLVKGLCKVRGLGGLGDQRTEGLSTPTPQKRTLGMATNNHLT